MDVNEVSLSEKIDCLSGKKRQSTLALNIDQNLIDSASFCEKNSLSSSIDNADNLIVNDNPPIINLHSDNIFDQEIRQNVVDNIDEISQIISTLNDSSAADLSAASACVENFKSDEIINAIDETAASSPPNTMAIIESTTDFIADDIACVNSGNISTAREALPSLQSTKLGFNNTSDEVYVIDIAISNSLTDCLSLKHSIPSMVTGAIVNYTFEGLDQVYI
jgi:hypothetical protein